MTFWTGDRIVQALGEQLTGARPAGLRPYTRVVTDSRELSTGDVFVALIGERFDAHDFLPQAVQRGAAAVVVSDASRCAGLGVPVFAVDDTTRALGALGNYRRRVWGGPVVAVAGSNGKTSTKELMAAALSPRFSVHATRGNLNNHIGVPLTLLAIPDDAEIAVVEIGTNHPGEVGALRALAEPDIAVVTSVGEEHLEGLGDLAGVLREESAIFEGVSLAIAPAGQPEIGREARAKGRRVVEAGTDSGDVVPDTHGLGTDGRGWAQFGNARLTVPLLGMHNLRNALLAVAVARACGIPDAESTAAIALLAPLHMRSTLESFGALTVLNDAYNANPASAREALALLGTIGAGRPQVAVLGSMLELGGQGRALHEEIARRALASDAQVIAGVGEFVSAFARVAHDDARVVTAIDAEALWPLLAPRLAPDAVILLKGSRGTRLERLVPYLKQFAALAPP